MSTTEIEMILIDVDKRMSEARVSLYAIANKGKYSDVSDSNSRTDVMKMFLTWLVGVPPNFEMEGKMAELGAFMVCLIFLFLFYLSIHVFIQHLCFF